MKRLFSLLFAVMFVLLIPASASARTVSIIATGKTIIQSGDWNYEKINNDTQCELDEYLGESEEVVVPRFFGDLLVVQMGDYCFANNSAVKRVITSSPMWTIGEYAFANCTSLEYFECNYALNTIKTGAFSGASALKSINLETSIVSEIQPFSFMNSGLEEVSLPDTCIKLGGYSFAQCYQLEKITIPASVTEIADTAFDKSENLTLYCYTDSYAHQYAVAKDIPFVLIDAPVEVTFIMGDSDGDGFITVMDATKVQRVLADLDEDPDGMIALRAAEGETLNIMHATAIQRYLADYDVKEPIGEEVTRTVTV